MGMDDDLNTITTGSKGWKQAHEYFREEQLGEDCRGARLQDSPLDSTQKKKYVCYRDGQWLSSWRSTGYSKLGNALQSFLCFV